MRLVTLGGSVVTLKDSATLAATNPNGNDHVHTGLFREPDGYRDRVGER